jgi:hypothetical protein
MRHTAQELDKAFTAPRDTISFWLFLAGLFFFVFLLWGKPVPFSNEFPYLLRLVKEAQPEFLLNDWTFSVPANEHWLFNRLFGFLATLLPIEILGWLGRIALWALTLKLLLRIGRLWKIPVWAAAVAIAFWLAIGQSLVADEWIVGGFEAKGISYVFLLSALYYFSLQRSVLPAVLLGIAFAFHPAIGLWSALAIGFALLLEKTNVKTLAKIVGLTSVIALIGIVPLVVEQFGRQPDSVESWRYIVLVRFPWHFDPYYFSRGATVLLLAMLAFNFAVFRRSDSFAIRFLLKFQIVLAIFFLAAFVLRWFEMFEWLRFLPVRLFPVFTPLFFASTVFRAWTLTKSKRSKILIALFVFAIIFRLNPIAASFTAIQNTYVSWTAASDDFQKTSAWIAANTPNGAIVIQPPHRRDVWYLSRRATVATYAYQTFGRLDEWRERVADLTGNAAITDSQTGFQTVEAAFNSLSTNQINEIRKKYAATYLVSRAEYPFPVAFQTETYKIYRLPND